MQRGISLVELLLVLVVAGLLGAIAVPRLDRPLATVRAETAAQRLARAHARARMTALIENRVAALRFHAESLTISVIDGRDTVRRWAGAGPATDGATLTGPTRHLLFTPTGITFGVSNGTWVVRHRGVERRVITSRYGRVRIERP